MEAFFGTGPFGLNILGLIAVFGVIIVVLLIAILFAVLRIQNQ